jgi:hypothetical protein
MQENTSPDPSATSIDMKPTPGGGIAYTYNDGPGSPVLNWSMSHSQALTLAARTLGLLGYRELHLRDDFTVSLAT